MSLNFGESIGAWAGRKAIPPHVFQGKAYPFGLIVTTRTGGPRRAFNESKPSGDPKTSNCLDFIETEDRYLGSSYIWTKNAIIANRELNQRVTAAGKKVSYAYTILIACETYLRNRCLTDRVARSVDNLQVDPEHALPSEPPPRKICYRFQGSQRRGHI